MPDKPFRFICGEDDYFVSEKGRAWFLEQSKDLTEDLSKEIIDGRALNMAEAEDIIDSFIGSVQTLSLFAERKVIWLKDVNFLADDRIGRSQGIPDLLNHLKTALESVDPAVVRVLITTQRVDKRRSFYKWCQKTADFTALAIGRDTARQCAELIRGECEQAGVRISHDAVNLLIGRLNGHSRMIAQETRKLLTFWGQSEDPIDVDTVMHLVPTFGDVDFFEAADVFYLLKLSDVLDALHRHFFTNKDARPLLGSLQSRNRLLIQIRVLLDAGAIRLSGRNISKESLESAARTYGHHFGDNKVKNKLNIFTQNPWYLNRLAQTASTVPLKKLIDFQIAFTEAFEAIIDRPNDQEEVCRELAVRCLS